MINTIYQKNFFCKVFEKNKSILPYGYIQRKTFDLTLLYINFLLHGTFIYSRLQLKNRMKELITSQINRRCFIGVENYVYNVVGFT